MGAKLFNYGVNAVCFEKNGRKFGMICSWAMQADYDKILMLLGAQSVTGRNISRGDVIGVSALNVNQTDVRDKLGNNHSNEVDKFSDLDYTKEGSALLINGASVGMVVEVLDVLHLPGIEEDNLVYGLVKSLTQTDAPMMQFDE